MRITRHPRRARALLSGCIALVTFASLAATASTGPAVADTPTATGAAAADIALDNALVKFVQADGGPPGIAVVVQRGATPVLHRTGVADTTTGTTIGIDEGLRLASTAKAFSGAAALALVGTGDLAIDATIGTIRPDLPSAWGDVTVAQLLQHTSGIPDFSQNKDFATALKSSLLVAPAPEQLLSYVADEPLEFEPGSRYHYSNSDNIVIGLMVEKVTGKSYADALADLVYEPLGLTATTLPRDATLPAPYVHGYDLDPKGGPPEDVSELFAAGWSWASGGIVSTPADTNRFIRGYAHGDETTATALQAQTSFRNGSSEPPGPGTNSAGLAIFRYRTTCGTLYGHTGNTPGYTQFFASSLDGKHSTTVSINAQITPKSDPKRFVDLRRIFTFAACAALADD